MIDFFSYDKKRKKVIPLDMTGAENIEHDLVSFVLDLDRDQGCAEATFDVNGKFFKIEVEYCKINGQILIVDMYELSQDEFLDEYSANLKQQEESPGTVIIRKR